MSDIRTMNLNDKDDGMVSLDNPSTTFVQENAHEKNMSQSKDTTTMDSTPISELMGGASAAPDIMAPPMMTAEPRMQSVLATAPQMQQVAFPTSKCARSTLLPPLSPAMLPNFPPEEEV